MAEVTNQAVTSHRKRSRGLDAGDILVFVIPCLQFIQLKVIGVLNGSDLLLLATFLYLAGRGRIRVTTPVGKSFLVFCSLWLFSQCVTDIVRHTPFVDYARGWSNIGMTLVNFTVLYILMYGRPRRLMLFGWGFVAGSLLLFFFNPDEFIRGDPWKFGLAYPATFIVLLLASRATCRGHWPIALTLLIGSINIYLGSRNMGGACMAAALYQLTTYYLGRSRKQGVKLKHRTVAAIAASIILGAIASFLAYQYTASTGILGEEARSKYEGESTGAYGVLLGGRPEMLGSIPAIYDSPILGHGSWARDPTYLILEIQSAMALGYKNAIDISPEDFSEGNIPKHSCILGAWVDAGILGAIFWGWVLVLTVRVLARVYPPTVVLLPIMSFIAFALLWDILFSPYGARARIIAPYYIVMLATCMSMAPYKVTPATAAVAKS